MATAEEDTCLKCGFPLNQKRNCSFCKYDNAELKMSLLQDKLKRVTQERDALVKQNRQLQDRISDLLLLAQIEGWDPMATPSMIDPSKAS